MMRIWKAEGMRPPAAMPDHLLQNADIETEFLIGCKKGDL